MSKVLRFISYFYHERSWSSLKSEKISEIETLDYAAKKITFLCYRLAEILKFSVKKQNYIYIYAVDVTFSNLNEIPRRI